MAKSARRVVWEGNVRRQQPDWVPSCVRSLFESRKAKHLPHYPWAKNGGQVTTPPRDLLGKIRHSSSPRAVAQRTSFCQHCSSQSPAATFSHQRLDESRPRWDNARPWCQIRSSASAFQLALRRIKVSSRLRRLFFSLSILVSLPARTAIATVPPASKYRLRLYHTHTNERIDVVYRVGDTYVPEATARLEHFLRDHRTGDERLFDPRLFDLLADLITAVGRPETEIDVVCGYRTPWSNEFLRRRSSAVAMHSLHMQAMAIDIRVPGTKTFDLRDAALSLQRGGVGYYQRSDFVHVDLGRVRRW